MVHLTVHSAEEALGRDVVSRLRGASTATWTDSHPHAPPQNCDAAAFVGHGPPEPRAIHDLLRAGKHVLVGTDARPARDILETLFDTARQANTCLAVVNPDRYLPSRQLIRQQLDAGKLGDPVLVRMHRWEPAAPHAASESPALPEPLVRDLDLALWLLGKPTDRVYAVEQRAGDLPCGRFLQVHLGCAGGGMALVDYADALPPGAGYQSLSVIGTAGAAYADDHSNMQLVYDGGHPRAVRTDEGTTYVAAMVQAFVAQLDAGGDPPGSVTSWQTVWGLADAVSRSLETGQAIAPGGI